MTLEPLPSLAQRLFVPLLLLAVLVAGVGGWWVQGYHRDSLHEAVVKRASTLVDAVVLGAETIQKFEDMQRFVTVLAAEREVQTVMIASGADKRIVASSRLGWLDKPATSIEDAYVRDLLERVWRSRQAALEVSPDGSLSYVVPLRLYGTQRDNPLLQDGMVLVQLNNQQMLRDALLSSLGLWGLLTLLTLLLVGLMVGLLVRWVTRPIAQMEAAINARMQGSPVRVAPARTRELARLADAYNDMLTAEQRANEQLYLIEKVFHNSQEGLIVTDATKIILMVNEAQCRMSGYQRAQLLGQHIGLLRSHVHTPAFYSDMAQSLDESGSWSGEVVDRRADGNLFTVFVRISPVRNAQGQITHYLSIATDVTEQKKAQARIAWLSEYDVLTGLPNQTSMLTHLQSLLADSDVDGVDGPATLAVVLLDVDRFKHVNEALGHDTGNQLLQQAADRLRQHLSRQDFLARLSGDEFVLIIGGMERDALLQRLQGLLAIMDVPYHFDGVVIRASVSMGVSLYPEHAMEARELLADADAALYQAKEKGRNTFVVYQGDPANRLYRLRLESDLKHAIEKGQLLLHYQPQIDMATGRILGVEALVRWPHPELGLVSPAEFIPLAEETGLIQPLGTWVLAQACQQARQWQLAGHELRVAVNVSSLQFSHADFVQQVADTLDASGLSPALLELELTESVMAGDQHQVAGVFASLKTLGVQLAIDDFGTGFSSLSYLKNFPLDRLKVDQSFVRSMQSQDASSLSVVQAVIELANAFSLVAIAEGVETLEQAMLLRQMGCEECQGFLCARPMPAEDLLQMIRHSPVCPLLRPDTPSQTLP